MIHLVFYSSLTGSVGEISHDLLKEFEKAFKVDFICKQDEENIELLNKIQNCDIFLSHFCPPNSVFFCPGFINSKIKVLIQPIDGTSFTDEFKENLNKFDFIITPSKHGKKIMLKNSIRKPIEIIPNYFFKEKLDKIKNADKKEYELPKKLKKLTEGKIIYYHESTHHPRKGIEYMYEGFVKAFSNTDVYDKVVLISKDVNYNQITFERTEKIKNHISLIQKQYKYPATILKISQYLNESDLEKLWKNCDFYVSLSKIEGFGIPLLRMAYLEKPILALKNDYNGYQQFLNHKNSYLIPSISCIAKDEFMNIYTKESKWSEPYIEDVIEFFKKSYTDLKLNKVKKPDKNKIIDYEFKNISEKYIKFLNSIYLNM